MIEIDWFLKSLNHSCLDDEDICYYLMEYTAHGGYEASDANQLVFNFKKDLSHKGKTGWHYKESAINKIATIYNSELPNIIDFKSSTLIPIPPSKCKSNSLYDDRMLKLVSKVASENEGDVKELLLVKSDMPSSHTTNNRDVNEIMDYITVDENLSGSIRQNIYLFDDVLVTGAHFAACKRVILKRFPRKQVSGIFIARAIN